MTVISYHRHTGSSRLSSQNDHWTVVRCTAFAVSSGFLAPGSNTWPSVPKTSVVASTPRLHHSKEVVFEYFGKNLIWSFYPWNHLFYQRCSICSTFHLVLSILASSLMKILQYYTVKPFKDEKWRIYDPS